MKSLNRMLLGSMAVGALGAAIVAGGCAGNGALAAGKVTSVERAINDAKASTATVDAPAELRAAEDGLAAARSAMAERDYDRAIRLADKASADADYARTKAISAKSKKMAEDIRGSVKTLQQEIERMPAK